MNAALVASTLGIDQAGIPLMRVIPIRLYLSTDARAVLTQTTNAIQAFHESFDFVVSNEFPTEYGSFLSKWFAKTKSAATSPAVTERLAKAELALEYSTLRKQQAEVDSAQAGAAASLIQALADTENAACQIGSILLLKNQSGFVVRTLSPNELIYLEKNQKLLRQPDQVLEALSEAKEEEKLPHLPDCCMSQAVGSIGSSGTRLRLLALLRIPQNLPWGSGVRRSLPQLLSETPPTLHFAGLATPSKDVLFSDLGETELRGFEDPVARSPSELAPGGAPFSSPQGFVTLAV